LFLIFTLFFLLPISVANKPVHCAAPSNFAR